MGDPRTLGGRWRVISTTSPYLGVGDRLAIFAGPEGLELAGTGSPSLGTVVPWDQAVAARDRATGDVTLQLGGGTSVVLRPEDGAEPMSLLAALHEWGDPDPIASLRRSPYGEYAAGPDRVLVVYPSGDTGDELEPLAYLEAIAADAQLRGESGWSLVSLVGVPLRHAAAREFFSAEGSGMTTKAVIGGLYVRA